MTNNTNNNLNNNFNTNETSNQNTKSGSYTYETTVLDKVNDDKTILISTSSQSNQALEKTIRRIWRTSRGEKLTKISSNEEYVFQNNEEFKNYKIFEIQVKEMFKELNNRYIECWNFLHRLINKMNFSRFREFFDYSKSDLNWIDEVHLINIKNELFNKVENTIDLTHDQLKILMLKSKNDIADVYLRLNKIYKDFFHFEEKMESLIAKDPELKEFKKQLKAKEKRAIRKNKRPKVILIWLLISSLFALAYAAAIVCLKIFNII